MGRSVYIVGTRRGSGVAAGCLAVALLAGCGTAGAERRTEGAQPQGSNSPKVISPQEDAGMEPEPAHLKLKKKLLALGAPAGFTEAPAYVSYHGSRSCFDDCPSVTLLYTGPAMGAREATRIAGQFFVEKGLLSAPPPHKEWLCKQAEPGQVECDLLVERGGRGYRWRADIFTATDKTKPARIGFAVARST